MVARTAHLLGSGASDGRLRGAESAEFGERLAAFGNEYRVIGHGVNHS